MKRILVPTDFTRNAESALVFANRLATRTNAEIVLLHCSHEPAFTDAVRQRELAQLRSLAERLRYQQTVRQDARRIRHTFEVRQGCLQNHVVSLMAAAPLDLIVMPLEYLDCVPAAFPGDHAARLMEVVECPVLLVPPHALARKLTNFVFATDFTDQDPKVLQQIAAFAELYNAHLSVVQVYGRTERHHLHAYKQGIKQLRQTLSYPDLSCHLLEEEDLLEGISDFAEKQQADLLVLATADSFLVRNLFDIRYTKTKAYHTQVPVLTFHQAKQKPCSGCCTQCAAALQETTVVPTAVPFSVVG